MGIFNLTKHDSVAVTIGTTNVMTIINTFGCLCKYPSGFFVPEDQNPIGVVRRKIAAKHGLSPIKTIISLLFSLSTKNFAKKCICLVDNTKNHGRMALETGDFDGFCQYA